MQHKNNVEGNSTKPILLVKAVTWKKDTHSLFDYQFTKNIVKDQIKVLLQPGFIFMYRNNQKSQIIFSRQTELKPKNINDQLLGCFEVVGKDKKYRLQFHQPFEFQQTIKQQNSIQVEAQQNDIKPKLQKIFFIIRSLKDSNNQPKGYKLKTGQYIKIGRVQFAITVKTKNQQNACPNQHYFDYQQVMNCDNIKRSQQDTCKICLSSQQSQGGYFFCQPCKCSGSVNLIHFQCLYQWCQTKIKKQSQGVVTQYNFKKFNCQICNQTYPRYIEKDKVRYDLMPIKKPQGPYISLLENKENSLDKKLLLIEYIDQKQLKIGRNHECQIRITDISISRKHAKIEMKNNNFFMYDTKSKFGTLVCEPDLHIDLQMIKRGIQIGRTVATFEIKSNVPE